MRKLAFLTVLVWGVFALPDNQIYAQTDVEILLSHGTIYRIWSIIAQPGQGLIKPVQPPVLSTTPPVPLPTVNTAQIDEVNYMCAQWDMSINGDTLPFDTLDTSVSEFWASEPLPLVRLIPDSGRGQGGWLMQSQYVRGLTPEQLRDRFALPQVPTQILIIRAPPYKELLPNGRHAGFWVGTAGAIRTNNEVWGFGSGPQIRVISDYGTSYFSDPSQPDYYGFLGLFSQYYFHQQPIGQTALSYKPLAGDGNAGQVASYLDDYIPKYLSDFGHVYDVLDWLNFAPWGSDPLQSALNQIGAERFDSLSYLGFRNALLFANAMLDRNELLRAAMCECNCSIGCPGTWLQGIGEFGNIKSEEENFGYNYQTGGFTVGWDWMFAPCVVGGCSIAYLGSHLGWKDDGGSAHVDSVKFGVYGSYFPGPAFFDLLAVFGGSWSHSRRHIQFGEDYPIGGGVDRDATAKERGHDFEFHLDGGYSYCLCQGFLTPLARLSYFHGKQNHFHEDDANSLNLSVDDFGAEIVRTYLELGYSRTYAIACLFKMIPEVRLGWAHDFPLDNRLINASLPEIGKTYTVNGFHKDTNSLIASAELTFLTHSGVILSGRWEGEICDHFISNEVRANLRYLF